MKDLPILPIFPLHFYTNSLFFLLTNMLGCPSGDIFKPIELRVSACASVWSVMFGSLLATLVRVSRSVKGLANSSGKLSCETPDFF